ncbi:MAG: hypothetical protein WCK35_09415 [Chloroflexota bacterium]
MDKYDSLQVLNNLNRALGSNGQPEATRAMLLLLKAQSPAGCWEHSGNQLCTPVQTTQALDGLLSIDYKEWISDNTSPVRLAIKWLCDNQFSQGNWGEDPSDTAEVIRILMYVDQKMLAQGCKDPIIEKVIKKGVEYLRNICEEKDARFIENRNFGWYGSAFWATSAVVFHLAGELALARDLLDDIWSFRKDITNTNSSLDGCSYFEAPDQMNDNNLRIWNTAHTIIGLTRLTELSPTGYNLSPFLRWLEYQQNFGEKINERIKGSWGINAAHIGGDSLSICSYAAIVALQRARSTKAPIELGVKWFDKIIRETDEGKLGNTLLCAAGAMYSTVYSAKNFMPFLPLDTIIQVKETINQQSSKIKELTFELDNFQQQYGETFDRLSKNLNDAIQSRDKLQKEVDGYVFKIHRENLGVWGLIGLVLGILGLIISFILR